MAQITLKGQTNNTNAPDRSRKRYAEEGSRITGRHNRTWKQGEEPYRGKGFIIGGTANTFADIRQHVADGADYIGCGPFRFTTTKQKLSPILGLDGYRSILDVQAGA